MTIETEPEAIRYTADVVCIRSGAVLLIERDHPPHEGAWALPGGHVDLGETSRAAAARELAEETGVQVTGAHLHQVGVWDAPGRDPRGRYVTVAYVAAVPAGTEAVAGDDARRAEWWPLSALPDLAFDHADIIDAARTGERLHVAHARFLPGSPKHGFSKVSADLDVTYTFEVTAEAVAAGFGLAPTKPKED